MSEALLPLLCLVFGFLFAFAATAFLQALLLKGDDDWERYMRSHRRSQVLRRVDERRACRQVRQQARKYRDRGG